jgi:MoaA/NifB/PqqE/SkfB family radical SAM enzyme
MGRLLWVAFGGGEPFLRPDLPELAGIFHDACRPAFLTIPTNGSLPGVVAGATEEILRRCPGSAVVLKLSLDGVGARHDALRRAPGSFERLLETHRRLARLAAEHPRLELGVNTLFCAENQAQVGGIIDFVQGLEGVRSHTLTMARGRTPGGAGPLDLDTYRGATLKLERIWGARRERRHRFGGARLKAAQDRLQRLLIHRTLLARRRLVPCEAGRLSLVLSESGDLHPCEERPGRSLGNVREAGYDVRALLRSARTRAARAEIAGGGCWCSHECNFVTNILFNPRLLPDLAREYGRLALGLERTEDPRYASWGGPRAAAGGVGRALGE